MVLQNGPTWRDVRLVEMDTWSLLVDTDQGRVLLPKHAVDAYLLDTA